MEARSEQRIVIVDYGLGNVGSIRNILRKAGLRVVPTVSADTQIVRAADKLILPGVGHFDKGMKNLAACGVQDCLKERVAAGVPLLGICLGMQLLSDWSDEGGAVGLGLIPGRVRRFAFDPSLRLKIPHMGWNWVQFAANQPIAKGLENEARFYFVHSYHFCCEDPQHSIGTTEYGYAFTSVVRRDNVIGVQFHPEKSHRFGLQLINNFLDI